MVMIQRFQFLILLELHTFQPYLSFRVHVTTLRVNRPLCLFKTAVIIDNILNFDLHALFVKERNRGKKINKIAKNMVPTFPFLFCPYKFFKRIHFPLTTMPPRTFFNNMKWRKNFFINRFLDKCSASK